MHVLDLNGACYLLSVKCNVNVKSDVKKKKEVGKWFWDVRSCDVQTPNIKGLILILEVNEFQNGMGPSGHQAELLQTFIYYQQTS